MTGNTGLKAATVATSIALALSGGVALAEETVADGVADAAPETFQAQDAGEGLGADEFQETGEAAPADAAADLGGEATDAPEEAAAGEEAPGESAAGEAEEKADDAETAGTEEKADAEADGAKAEAEDKADDAKKADEEKAAGESDVEGATDAQLTGQSDLSSRLTPWQEAENTKISSNYVDYTGYPYNEIDADSEVMDSLKVETSTSSYDHETTLYRFSKKDDSVDSPDSRFLYERDYVLKDGKYVMVPPTIDLNQVDQDELTVLGEDEHQRYYLYRGQAYIMPLSEPGMAHVPQGAIPSSFTTSGDDAGQAQSGTSSASYAGYEPTAASPTPATGTGYVPSATDAKASAKSAAEDATPATGDPTSLAGAIAAAMTSVAAFVAAKSTRRH